MYSYSYLSRVGGVIWVNETRGRVSCHLLLRTKQATFFLFFLPGLWMWWLEGQHSHCGHQKGNLTLNEIIKVKEKKMKSLKRRNEEKKMKYTCPTVHPQFWKNKKALIDLHHCGRDFSWTRWDKSKFISLRQECKHCGARETTRWLTGCAALAEDRS